MVPSFFLAENVPGRFVCAGLLMGAPIYGIIRCGIYVPVIMHGVLPSADRKEGGLTLIVYKKMT